MSEGARALAAETGQVKGAMTRFCDAFGLPSPDDAAASVASLATLAEAVREAGAADLGFGLEPNGKAVLEELGHALITLKAYRNVRTGPLERVSHDSLASATVPEWRTAREAAGAKFWPMSVFARRRLNREIGEHLGLRGRKGLESEIDRIGELQGIRAQIEAHARELPASAPWRGLDTDIARAGGLLVRANALRDAIMRLTLPGLDPIDARAALRRVFVEGRERLEPGMPAARATDELADAHRRFAARRDALFAKAEIIERDVSLAEIETFCGAISERAGRLNAWCAWMAARREAEAAGLGALVVALEAGVISAQESREAFRTAYRRWLAPLLIDATPELRSFSSVAHEDLIRTFRALDQEICDTTAEYIRASLSSKVPSSGASSIPPGYGVLRREITKKSRHKPVRNLISEMGDALMTLTPCVMMSPLSVAQFLPADTALFDLVVFDEASQITVADAIGAIARGRRVIVVGDPKQMPPTSFFDKAAGEEGDDDATDLESILDEALAASAPLHRLTGHYRSRHESLIAFSNHAYYDGSLVTYPAADTRESAVSLCRVDGVYAKGKGRTNAIEAQAVVEEVVRRLRDPELSKLSIGVVTLNAEQQKLILDLLDEARREEHEIEEFFGEGVDDPVFVKNLETVQGDQRDVILLSVTYGPTGPGARTMSMNFGPLNKSGGERRLNVAITRATTEVVVFASFDPTMIDLSRTSARAIHDLRAYLDFAARGPVALGEAIHSIGGRDSYDSDFEMAVADGLRRRGWDVRTQIGVSKFRIDLGIVDPDSPGRFLAGVECDGATYHSSPSARDRDRVRHAILERLGWRLLRVWSTDWFIDPKARLEKLHEALTEILEEARAERAEAEGKKSKADASNVEGDALALPGPDAGETGPALLPLAQDGDGQDDDADHADGGEENASEEVGADAWRPAARGPASGSLAPTRDEPGDLFSMSASASGARNGAEPATGASSDADRSDAADRFYDDDYLPEIAALALSIIDREGPVRLERLVSQVARAHGFQRAGRAIRARVEAAVARKRPRSKDTGGLVFWTVGAEPVKVHRWRGLSFDGIERDWREIPDAEMIDLARRILQERHLDPPRAMADAIGLRRLASGTKSQFEELIARARSM
jgi:very-short-patch-repair endonuclease